MFGEDARLAEVASCHQILSIVLHKPATVSVSLRNRIVQLGQLGEAKSKPVPVVESDGRKPKVFEALRDSVNHRDGRSMRLDAPHIPKPVQNPTICDLISLGRSQRRVWSWMIG